ncbi:MAG: hypothetical protein NC819_00545 [Candidatus Omnitrophica bacterium]|nr:hypothetical protein [Candidatus Omnitrophota bacterium]
MKRKPEDDPDFEPDDDDLDDEDAEINDEDLEADDEDDEDEEEGEESSDLKDPVYCPVCGSDSVRLIEMHYEMGLYECERCHLTFEDEG